MTEKPLVSVLITAYNRHRYITEAVESVLKSSYRNLEVIIVDDCSTDNTFMIAKEFEERDQRVRVFKNEKNLGDYPNRNKAAGYAKGKYIVYVDSDDTIFPNGIERLVTTMEAFPDASLGMFSPIPGTPNQLSSTEAIQNHFLKKPFLMMGPGGTIQRLEFFRQIKCYPEKYGPANDMYYNLKACCYSPIVLMPFDFMNYRRHEGQEINNTAAYLYNSYLYLRDAIRELPMPLNNDQKEWIIKKNKRRFAVNLLKLLARFDVSKIKLALNKTQFSTSDFMEGIFH